MRIVLSGLGRAGRALAELVVNGRRDEITCAVCRDTSSDAGSTVGEAVKVTALSNCPVYPLKLARSAIAFSSADVLIDFSDRSFTLDLFDLAREKGWGLVVCTTDHEPEVVSAIRRHAESGEIGVVYAPNLTLGVNLLLEFTRRLSKVLPDFDFAVVERHRRGKPPVSATARLIADAAGGHDVPIAYVRAGGYVGIHELTAASEFERISIVHESFSRGAFANGALLAARFLGTRKGFFTMEDVISDLDSDVL